LSVLFWRLKVSHSDSLLAFRELSECFLPLQQPSGAGAPLWGAAHRSDPRSSSERPADMIENDHI
jgi:hypothetical protein